MSPRPFYRWKSFWLGVLVLAFLGWAWCDSIRSDSGISFIVAGRPVGASSREATVAFSSVDQITTWGGNWRFTDHYRYPTETPFYFPPLSYAIKDAGPADIHRVRIPYWFLILVFLVPWSGWLAWRWRRMKRLHAKSGKVDA